MKRQGGKDGVDRKGDEAAWEMAPLNGEKSAVFEIEELEKRLEMQRLPLGPSLETAAGCYTDACDQVCEIFCTDYTGCMEDCMCNFEDCFDKCGTDCLMLCYIECLADCGFCAGDW